ncbi:hypothetical protein ACUN59_005628, partial [Klebsiella variicola]
KKKTAILRGVNKGESKRTLSKRNQQEPSPIKPGKKRAAAQAQPAFSRRTLPAWRIYHNIPIAYRYQHQQLLFVEC